MTSDEVADAGGPEGGVPMAVPVFVILPAETSPTVVV